MCRCGTTFADHGRRVPQCPLHDQIDVSGVQGRSSPAHVYVVMKSPVGAPFPARDHCLTPGPGLPRDRPGSLCSYPVSGWLGWHNCRILGLGGRPFPAWPRPVVDEPVAVGCVRTLRWSRSTPLPVIIGQVGGVFTLVIGGIGTCGAPGGCCLIGRARTAGAASIMGTWWSVDLRSRPSARDRRCWSGRGPQ